MSAVWCPHCSKRIGIQPNILAAILWCPSCSNELYARRGRRENAAWLVQAYEHSSGTAAPGSLNDAVAEEIARLIAPHSCHQCHAPIAQVIGKARTTLECPACKNRTSAYAVMFRCRDCSILLEAPTAQAGYKHPCPGCGKSQVVPASMVERSIPAAEDADDWFGFYCPSCWDNVVVKKADVGERAVCPHCFVTFDVPHCGHRAKEPEGKQEPLPEVHCPRCELLIPMGAAVCTMCGLDLKKPR
jgi:DNA-directed RNA polymerase subunit M/transcription elongation factor TFIIS